MEMFDAESDLSVTFFEMLARFRALSLLYQEIHWSNQGHHFYPDHLLAERLYNEVSDVIDAIAEKGIGVTQDRGFVLLSLQLPRVAEILDAYPHVGDTRTLFAGALAFENDLGAWLDEKFQTIKSAGVNDFLGQLADDGLQRVYLLTGRLSESPDGPEAQAVLSVARSIKSQLSSRG